MTRIIEIDNHGQEITHTNFWQSQIAQLGNVFLSFHLGALRVLVPECRENWLPEMQTAKIVVVSRGPFLHTRNQFYELLFDNGSDTPFWLHAGIKEQADRVLPAQQHGHSLVVAVWTQNGRQLKLPGVFRLSRQLPNLTSFGGMV